MLFHKDSQSFIMSIGLLGKQQYLSQWGKDIPTKDSFYRKSRPVSVLFRILPRYSAIYFKCVLGHKSILTPVLKLQQGVATDSFHRDKWPVMDYRQTQHINMFSLRTHEHSPSLYQNRIWGRLFVLRQIVLRQLYCKKGSQNKQKSLPTISRWRWWVSSFKLVIHLSQLAKIYIGLHREGQTGCQVSTMLFWYTGRQTIPDLLLTFSNDSRGCSCYLAYHA